MDSLQEILASRYRASVAREQETQRLLKRQKCEERIKLVDEKNRNLLLSFYFQQLKKNYFSPWLKDVRTIIRFLRWVHFWGKSKSVSNTPQMTYPGSDEEIQENTRREYRESLLMDQAKETVPITFWVNRYCQPLSNDISLIDYIGRNQSVSEFSQSVSEWPSLGRLLFWIRVHSNAENRFPRWLPSNIQEIALSHIITLANEIRHFEKHMCPHCDGMFAMSDLVDFGDYKICYLCNTMVGREFTRNDENYGECVICFKFANVRLYDDLTVCENCARREGIFRDALDETVSCPGCGQTASLSSMHEHEDGIYFCSICAHIAGIEHREASPAISEQEESSSPTQQESSTQESSLYHYFEYEDEDISSDSE